MKQGSLFDILTQADPDEAVGLAGLMPAIRAAMNRVAGKDEEGRKLLVDKLNNVAKRENVALTNGGGKSIEKTTLDKWLQSLDQGHRPSFEAIVVFLLATGDATPLKPLLKILGLEVIAKEDLPFLEYGKALATIKNAKAQLKKAEARL